ncbi:MAG: uroporphyrinogen-III C-methyltransferase [bacterium]
MSTVYLVGAGPGDPDLITRKGYKLLLEADTVFVDRLAPSELIDDLSDETRVVNCGKGPDGHRMNQEEINRNLLEESRGDGTVVRLKGGDPLIFGRGGEEYRYLRNRGVDVEIVPGISAANAASSALSVPLTDREIASEVTFLTGHEAPNKQAENLDWECMATCRKTLAVYMGVNQLPKISQTLMDLGRKPETSALAVENVSRSNQRVMSGTLRTLPDLAKQFELTPPALVLIGDVGDYFSEEDFNGTILTDEDYLEAISESSDPIEPVET